MYYKFVMNDNIKNWKIINKKYKKYSECDKLFLNEHNCNNERIEYYHSQIKKM